MRATAEVQRAAQQAVAAVRPSTQPTALKQRLNADVLTQYMGKQHHTLIQSMVHGESKGEVTPNLDMTLDELDKFWEVAGHVAKLGLPKSG